MKDLEIGDRSDERLQGKVKKWFEEKGFGFIESNGKEFFVHITKVQDKAHLKVGQEVSFKSLNSTKGVQAVDVTF